MYSVYISIIKRSDMSANEKTISIQVTMYKKYRKNMGQRTTFNTEPWPNTEQSKTCHSYFTHNS